MRAGEGSFGGSAAEFRGSTTPGDTRRALTRRIGAINTTARFYIQTEQRYLQALLDYIMVSPGLREKKPRWRIWHPFEDPGCWRVPELRDALLTASDHFPVTMDIEL